MIETVSVHQPEDDFDKILRHVMWLGDGAVWGQELDLMGPFQLNLFCGSVIYVSFLLDKTYADFKIGALLHSGSQWV